MRLARNMAAAMANSVVVVLVNLVALPFYLRFLGMEAYGLIGFYATLQTVLQVLDLGLAPTVSREIAHNAEVGEGRRSASLLRTLGVVYGGVAVLIAGLLALSSQWIATQWLQANQLSEVTLTHAIALMGINLACRWPISLYHNALVGAHRLALSSVVSIVVNIAAALTAILVLAFVAKSILAFFVVQAVFGMVHVLILRGTALRVVGDRRAPRDFGELKRIWRFSAWMGGIAITGLVLSQVDKLVLSRILALESFGHYMLATLLVSGLQVLTTPAFNALYPKFATLHARGDTGSLEHLYRVGTRLFATALFAIALVLVFHTHSLIVVWLGDPAVAAAVAPIAALLASGSALTGVMYFPYALQLATGKPHIAFSTIVALIVVVVPLVLLLASRWGALGGAVAWACLGALYLLLGTWLTGRKVANFAGWPWLRSDVAIPLVATALPALLGAWLCRTLDVGAWAALGIGGMAALMGMGLGVAAGFGWRDFRGVVAMALGRTIPSP